MAAANQLDMTDSQELQGDQIKGKLITFFKLCDTNKNGKVTWNEFWEYRQKYAYKNANDFHTYATEAKQADKDTFVWLAAGEFDNSNHKGFFTWDDVRSRFTDEL